MVAKTDQLALEFNEEAENDQFDSHEPEQEEEGEEEEDHQEIDNEEEKSKKRIRHLKYLSSLTENELLELAQEVGIPRERVAPHVKLMLKNFRFVARTLLEDEEVDCH
ncbi:hypothetical protein FRC07_006431 [Ceratobasidium sp. 392]|nr:hypothetical protein FRC07_006431 [Ceratobasidium sp. 392]